MPTRAVQACERFVLRFFNGETIKSRRNFTRSWRGQKKHMRFSFVQNALLVLTLVLAGTGMPAAQQNTASTSSYLDSSGNLTFNVVGAGTMMQFRMSPAGAFIVPATVSTPTLTITGVAQPLDSGRMNALNNLYALACPSGQTMTTTGNGSFSCVVSLPANCSAGQMPVSDGNGGWNCGSVSSSNSNTSTNAGYCGAYAPGTTTQTKSCTLCSPQTYLCMNGQWVPQ